MAQGSGVMIDLVFLLEFELAAMVVFCFHGGMMIMLVGLARTKI